MELTNDQIGLLESNGFQICTFLSDGDCDGVEYGKDCQTPQGGRCWFESTGGYEYPNEGNYYCDAHALKRLEEIHADRQRLEEQDWDEECGKGCQSDNHVKNDRKVK